MSRATWLLLLGSLLVAAVTAQLLDREERQQNGIAARLVLQLAVEILSFNSVAKTKCDPPCERGRMCFVNNHCGCRDGFGGERCKEVKTCPEGQVFKTCADSCTLTCEARRNNACTKKCEEGCTCLDGFTKNAAGKCVAVDKCPCVVAGKEYEEGSHEKWTCKPVTKGQASMSGDPHYTSVDGRRFDFMGRCGYKLLQHPNFTIEAENIACAGTPQGVKFFEEDKNKPTCTKSLTIRLPQLTAHLLQGREVVVNGRKVTKFPFQIFNLKIIMGSSNFVIAQFADGVEVQWDGSTTAHVTVPEQYYGEAKGLLGTYNNDPSDDITTSDGILATTIEQMGNSWKVDDTCPNVKPVPHPCVNFPDKKEAAEKACAVLQGPYDMCQCRDTEPGNCVCPIIANYARQCQLHAITCPATQVYLACADPCKRSCSDILLDPNCKSSSCVEGCGCPGGQILDRAGKCVLISHTCQGGKWACVTQPGATCSGSGDPHYTSFDGRRFDYMGAATYYLLKLEKELIVEATNQHCFGAPTCTNRLRVRLPGLKVDMLQGRQVRVNDQPVSLPWEGKGIRVYAESGSRIVAATSDFVYLKWDGVYNFWLTVPGFFYGKTKGLCGTFNSNANDDLQCTHHHCPWKTDDASLDPIFSPHPCAKNAALGTRADALCLTVKNPVFAKCHGRVNPEATYENCRFDVCACTNPDVTKCACPIFASYASECAKQHVPVDWRNSVESCKIQCPAGQIYQACAESCGRTCRDVAIPCTNKECAEGCNCPPGQALDDQGKCIPRGECPCIHNNVHYKKGQQMSRDLGNGNTCANARWTCESQNTVTCSATGDPHYTTFDGKKYDFMGQCSYYLVHHPTFSIEAENVGCGAAVLSCTKSVTVRVGRTRVSLLRDFAVKLDEETVTSVPLETKHFTVRRASSSQMIVSLWNGVEVGWDGVMGVYVTAPGTLLGQTQGLCGTFNGNLEDEWLLPDEKKAKTAEEFADAWRTDKTCGKARPAPKTCEQNPQKKPKAETLCNKLKGTEFAECHNSVDVAAAVADCQFDTCASDDGKENEVACRAMTSYVTECARSDVALPDWRNKVTECACGRTCRDVGIKCNSKCTEGCNCPVGQTLDREGGRCIPVSRCPCVHDNREYESDKTILRDRQGGGVELCTCVSAAWVCTEQKGSRCTVLDATHFSTLDGYKFTAQASNCPLVLLKTGTLSVVSKPGRCADKNGKCARPLKIVMDKVTVELQSNKEATFNGQKITSFPYEQRGVNLRSASTDFIVVRLDNSVEVWWDGGSRVYIDVPGRLFETTKALCGTFNGDASDDLTTKQGDVTTSLEDFIASWKAEAQCTDDSEPPTECDPLVKAQADNYCKHFKSKLFAECNAQVDVEPFYDNCIFDICECDGKPECMCPIYAVYADECAALGTPVNWRTQIKECATKCPAGLEYQVCGDSCKRSCRDLQQASCESKCVEGCNCPEGRTLDAEGNCVALEECACMNEGREYHHGATVLRNEANKVEFICTEGRWSCKEQAPARCNVLSNKHVTTFGGRRIEVESSCSYYLLKQEGLSVFSEPVCNAGQACVTSVTVEWGSEAVTLTEGATTRYNGRETPLPIIKPGVTVVEESSTSVLLKLQDSGFELQWDKADKIYLVVPPTFVGKVQGLCGTFNNERKDELVLRGGQSTTEVPEFATSWRVKACNLRTPVENKCDANDKLKPQAESNCKILQHRTFAACHDLVEVEAFHATCLEESCTCVETGTCVCEILSVYADECAAVGVPVDWRKLVPHCGVQCPAGQEFKACGNGCTHSCAAVSAGTCNRDRCVEGCHCPDGQSIDARGKCIPSAECSCTDEGGQVHKPGTNECKGGRFVCQEAPPGRCTNIGLPHYTTFDGTNYNFKANCEYYLLRTKQFVVQAELIACPAGKKNEALGDKSSNSPTCAKSVTVHAGNVRVELAQQGKITVDGDIPIELPVTARGVTIRRASATTIIVRHKNGIEVWWDDESKVRIDVPANFEGQTEGLCGTFNGKREDDLTTAQGEVTTNIQTFVDSWRVSPECTDKVELGNPCDRNPQRKQKAMEKCSVLKKAVFQPCHTEVDVDAYIDICMYELCACNLKSECACSIFKEYAESCAAEDILVDWTKEVSECAKPCPASQKYNLCGNTCGRSCGDVALEECPRKCIEGCSCPKGQVLNAQDKCVPIKQCPCVHNGKQYTRGRQIVRRPATKPVKGGSGNNGLEQCLCDDGRWDCNPATLEDLLIFIENLN
ncbi:hypothetical protein B566_EDAN013560 [Ephemera danica]|nr:hypothetical protein B566_EDAN013560 [Ephemera danica]